MTRTSVIMMWAAAILLAIVYLFPLWRIGLEAPQYPDGLGIDIWINKITGREAHDLQNINGLNHYIGMRAIEPDSIPELKFMKFILGGLAALAAIVALVRRRWLLAAWVIVAIILAGIGMYDFWKWEYDYGHNLDPTAAIKVPGMTYQPPMFGTKVMLNFRATAWPGIGGIAAMLGVGLGVLALAFEVLRKRKSGFAAAAVIGLLSLTACTGSESQPIEYGSDQCAYCLMSITEDRYGSELITTKGRAIKYDSIECMLNAVAEGDKIKEAEVAAWYVTDYFARGTLIDATAASYLHSRQLPSPMGGNLTAFSTPADAERMKKEKQGALYDWEELRHHAAAAAQQ